jgi:hypothetical protein
MALSKSIVDIPLIRANAGKISNGQFQRKLQITWHLAIKKGLSGAASAYFRHFAPTSP